MGLIPNQNPLEAEVLPKQRHLTDMPETGIWVTKVTSAKREAMNFIFEMKVVRGLAYKLVCPFVKAYEF